MNETEPQDSIHGSAVAIGDCGVLIRGRAGAGKSTLALNLIEDGRILADLVADDRVILRESHAGVVAQAPDSTAGLIELRGVGLLRRPHRAAVRLSLVVDLLPKRDCYRLPDEKERNVTLLSNAIPRLTVPIGSPDGVIRVSIALAEWATCG